MFLLKSSSFFPYNREGFFSILITLKFYLVTLVSFVFFLRFLFIYLTKRDTTREGTQAGGVGEGEAGLPRSREPDAGLDPRTLGS